MVIAFVYFAIMLYMIFPVAAFAFCVIAFGALLIFRKNTFLERLLVTLILSMPLYSLNILGAGFPHVLSWTTLLLIVLVVYAAFHLKTVSRAMVVVSVVLLALTCITSFYFSGVGVSQFYYFGLQLLFILPITLAFITKEQLAPKLTRVGSERLISIANQTIVATALAVLSQYGLYELMGISMGNISLFGGGRTVFDLTVDAFSVLSMFLGMGVVLNVLLFQKTLRVSYVFGALACLIGIIVNTSRTGLFAAIIVSLWLIAFPPARSGRKRRPFLLLGLVPIAAGGLYVISLLGFRRTLTNIFAGNGRLETYTNALTTSTKSWQNFLFGIGYGQDRANYHHVAPHNVVLETLLSSGVIVLVLVSILAILLLRFFKDSDALFPVVVLLLSAMAFSGFYAVTFVPAIVATFILTTTVASKSGGTKPQFSGSTATWLTGLALQPVSFGRLGQRGTGASR